MCIENNLRLIGNVVFRYLRVGLFLKIDNFIMCEGALKYEVEYYLC